MNAMGWIGIALSLLAAVVLAALIWIVGPLIVIADYQPLDGVLTRVLIILVIFLIVGGGIAWRIISRRRAAAALEKALTETDGRRFRRGRAEGSHAGGARHAEADDRRLCWLAL